MFRKHFRRPFLKLILKKTGLYGYVYDFSVDYRTIAVDQILNINKYLIEKNNIKRCFGLLKKCLL